MCILLLKYKKSLEVKYFEDVISFHSGGVILFCCYSIGGYSLEGIILFHETGPAQQPTQKFRWTIIPSETFLQELLRNTVWRNIFRKSFQPNFLNFQEHVNFLKTTLKSKEYCRSWGIRGNAKKWHHFGVTSTLDMWGKPHSRREQTAKICKFSRKSIIQESLS